MIVFLGVAVLCALVGAWLLFDFLLWFLTGYIVSARIEAFEKGWPVLAYETSEGKAMRARAGRITHMGYYLGHPQEGDVFNVIYRKKEPGQVRVYGYLYPVAGLILFIPFVAYLAAEFSKVWMATQVSFIVVFMVMILGGWLLLKLLRASY
ncbi:MAG: DUF3592 domain-containing protein [Alphaproteobacteria bacterium]